MFSLLFKELTFIFYLNCCFVFLQACPALSSPSDGYVYQFASPVFEDVISYSCDLGYALEGTNSRSCLSTGAWSGDDPSCVFAGKQCSI